MTNSFLRTSALSVAAFCLALSFSTAPAQAKDTNADLVRVAQMRLADLGYNVGNFDGITGQLTENALMDFQRNNGLPITGRLTPETYSLLTHGRVASDAARYQTYDNYYRTTDYNHVVLNTVPVAWEDRWHFVGSQDVPLRFARLNVREEDIGTTRHYAVTLNGQNILLANNQPGVLRVSETYTLNNEDAVIFTAYQASGSCPNKSYLLVVHSDGTFNRPFEIGDCAGSYEAHVSNNALFVSFPEINLYGSWQTWGTWRYENNVTVRI